MAKLEFFAGESVLIFDISDESLNWTKVYARSKSDYLRLGAMDFKTIKKHMLSNLPPPYVQIKSTINESWDNKFRVFPLMDTHASVVGDPSADGMLKILWLTDDRGFVPLMTLTPEDVQAWIHTLETFEIEGAKKFKNPFKRRRT